MKEIKSEWTVKGYWPYAPIKNRSMETNLKLRGVTTELKATVPGGIYLDLFKAGIIENPYFGTNSIKCEWVANRWWLYKTTIISEGLYNKLVLKGIDYSVYIYINGKIVKEHTGMFSKVILDIPSGSEQFELMILFKEPPYEMGQIGYTSKTFSQKARFTYKWDFSTRMPNIGIWDKLYLTNDEELLLAEVYVYADENGTLNFDNYTDGMNYKLLDNNNIISSGKLENQVKIERVETWNLNTPKLYQLELSLGNQVKEIDVGFRTIEFSHENEYKLIINGEKVPITGVNITPFDHVYGIVNREVYQFYLERCQDLNINLIRVWGGGIFEKDEFYEECSKRGIVVWQEFIQSSSGIDNIPNDSVEFLEVLKHESIAGVKRIRNHCSLIAYSGGNELMDENNIPITAEHKNIKLLEELVDEYDRFRTFIPTSAYGKTEFQKIEIEGLDVHGPWEMGENYFNLYNNSKYKLHSEFGMPSFSTIETLKKTIPSEHIQIGSMNINESYLHKGDWWGTFTRDLKYFKNFSSMEQFISASRFIQYQALRYALEANMIKAAGSIIWQLNEPWPNVSCTNVIEYSNIPKASYYATRSTYQNFDYYLQCEDFLVDKHLNFTVFANNLSTVNIYNELGANLYTTEALGKTDIDYQLTNEEVLIVKITCSDVARNYVFANDFSKIRKYKTSILVDYQDDNVIIKNCGKYVSVGLYLEAANNAVVKYFEDNCITLLPNEVIELKYKKVNRQYNQFIGYVNTDSVSDINESEVIYASNIENN